MSGACFACSSNDGSIPWASVVFLIIIVGAALYYCYTAYCAKSTEQHHDGAPLGEEENADQEEESDKESDDMSNSNSWGSWDDDEQDMKDESSRTLGVLYGQVSPKEAA